MRACTVVAHSMELDELLFSSFFMDHGNNNEAKSLSSNFTETITDLNELLSSKQSDQTIAIRIFDKTAVGSPDNYAAGMVISFRDKENYGSQLAIANGVIYSRQKTNGVWANWAK